MTVAQVATYLDAGEGHVTEDYVESLLKRRLLAGVKVANKWRVSEEALAAYVESGGTPRKRRSDAAPIPAAPVKFQRRTRSRAS